MPQALLYNVRGQPRTALPLREELQVAGLFSALELQRYVLRQLYTGENSNAMPIVLMATLVPLSNCKVMIVVKILHVTNLCFWCPHLRCCRVCTCMMLDA